MSKTKHRYVRTRARFSWILTITVVSVKYPGINLELLAKQKCDVMPSFVVAVFAEYTRNTVQSKTPFAPTLTAGE